MDPALSRHTASQRLGKEKGEPVRIKKRIKLDRILDGNGAAPKFMNEGKNAKITVPKRDDSM